MARPGRDLVISVDHLPRDWMGLGTLRFPSEQVEQTVTSFFSWEPTRGRLGAEVPPVSLATSTSDWPTPRLVARSEYFKQNPDL